MGDSTLVDDEAPRDELAPAGHTEPAEDELVPLGRRRGELLGRYVLLEAIGRGGMGVVHSAYDPELDRRVALKLLHAAGDERGSIRLLREAQAMAKLVHPNVVTVHDVGSFEGGVFVAMELVEGTDLREWLNAERHSQAEILEVFIAAGHGLEAAHRVGIVHRDFKPANVLVSRAGEVKVVDFGLARRVDESMDSSDLRSLASELAGSSSSEGAGDDGLTRSGALLGTPAYMSPEQHARRPVDAQSDQFSFCVALYEALLEQRPFEGHSRLVLAMATNRGELRPPPRGHTVPARIVRALQRGLSAKPGDRFPSMSELLAELSYDPSRRRNRLLVGTSVTALLAIGIGGYTRGTEPPPPPCARPLEPLAGTWDDELRAALREAFRDSALPYATEDARLVVERLDGWAERWADARQQACEQTRVQHEQPPQVLELRNACLERQRKDLAAVLGLLHEGDAETIERADRMVASLPAPEACADGEALGRLPPPADASTHAAVEAIRDELSEIRALRAAGRYDVAQQRTLAARERAEATGYQPVIAELLLLLGNLHNHGSDQAQGEQILHAAARAAAESRYDEVLAGAWLELAWNLGLGQSRHEEGLRWADYAEAIVNRMGRPDWLLTNLLCTQGNMRWVMQEPAAALERFESCLERREAADPHDPSIADTLSYIGNAQIDLGRYDDAEASFLRALEISTAAHGPDHPQVASVYNGLGVTYYYQHRLEQAEQAYRRAYEIDRKVLGPEHPTLLYSLGNIANIRREKGELEQALAAMHEVEALVRSAFPEVHREVGTTQHNIAELLALMGDAEGALARYDRALAVRTEVHGESAPYVANTLTGRGEVLLTLGRDAEAREALERALQLREGEEHPRPQELGRTRFALARALARQGQSTRARTLAEAARRDYDEPDSALQQQRRDEVDAWLAEHPAGS
ncbi:MAG: serine/threonine protein kinase [Myxococcales bacterium]|nr:serine/threonine protein kinase [Myxococcales bacterium]